MLKVGRISDILSEIDSLISIAQVKYLQKSDAWVYDILKTANLFNDDVMKHLVETEQTT